ncbi:hypothetical protein [Paucibacter soli]|uniref:hypothetical protein n=1 Tax=Paucibacter soli TaxID=3133433 RepID=UPI003094F46E
MSDHKAPVTLKGPANRLWCAMVGNTETPGTMLAFFHQEGRPTAGACKASFIALAEPDKLKVHGLFDVTQVLLHGPESNITAMVRGLLEVQSHRAELASLQNQAAATPVTATVDSPPARTRVRP